MKASRRREAGVIKAFVQRKVDLGTEPLVRPDLTTASSYLRKLPGYGHSYHDDLLYQFYGMENVMVLTIARDRQHATRTKHQQKTSRLEKLRAVFHDYGRRLFPAKNFLFADLDDVLASGDVLALPWTDGNGELRTII